MVGAKIAFAEARMGISENPPMLGLVQARKDIDIILVNDLYGERQL